MRPIRPLLFICFVFAWSFCGAQKESFVAAQQAPQPFTSPDDIFGCRAFIPNNGQYPPVKGKEVLYALDNGLEKIYFTKTGLIYELKEIRKLTERDHERMEHGEAPKPDKQYFVEMNWEGCNQNIEIDPSEQQPYYMTFGPKEYNSYPYKKLVYRDVYKNIDIEYIIPADKNRGIKYTVVLKPTANISDVRILYSGDVSGIKKIREDHVRISTPLEDLIEHAPLTFFEDGEPIASSFMVNDDVITFSLAIPFSSEKKILVDPWVVPTTTLTSNNTAFDIDYDFLGKTYVFGGYMPKVACYSTAGALQWVFMGSVTSTGWISNPSNYIGNFGVNKFTSKTYVGQGIATNGATIIRLDASGVYDNFTTIGNGSFRELWDMGFHCLSTDVFVMGGGTSSNVTAATMSSLTASLTLSAFNPTNTAIAQDIVSHAIDDQANLFVVYAGHTSVNNKIGLVAQSFTNSIWIQPTTMNNFQELSNKSGYQVPGGTSNGFNALAVNGNFLFCYDGLNLMSYNKSTGAFITSTTLASHSQRQQGGIAVDDCNNIYVGGNTAVRCFNFNGTSFSTLTPISINSTATAQFVYDIKLDKTTKTLYVCGSNFAGVYSPIHSLSCPTASSICLFNQGGIYVSSNDITCASLGSATCTATGGTGPFTYTWIPSGQTASVASNLQPGSHQIIVHDIGANNTYTAVTYIAPVVPLTGSVPGTLALNCPASNTVVINNLSGGSGNYSYLWQSTASTQTTAAAYNLTQGNHTVSVLDLLSNCTWSQAFVAVPPPAVSLTLSATAPGACAHNSITIYGLVSGGSPNYTYSWTSGPQTASCVVSESMGGTYVYTFTVVDTKSCTATKTISLIFTPAHTITVNSATICPLKVATLTASGASSYTWSNNNNGSVLNDSPLSTSVYTVTGSGSLCAASATAQILVQTVPSPTVSSNSPLCNGKSLQLTASGGIGYAWSGPSGYSSGSSQPIINPVSPLHSGVYTATVTAANSCTASASVNVTIYPTPVLTASGGTVCVTGPLNLTASSPVNGLTYLWTGPGTFTSSQQNPVVMFPAVNQSGNYTVTATDANACVNTAVVHVTVSGMPTASFTSNSPLCEKATLQLNGTSSSNALVYNWTGPNNFTSSQVMPFLANLTVPASGVYSLQVSHGPCVNTFTSSVLVNSLPSLFVQLSPSKICENNSFTLQLNTSPGVVAYSWHGPGGLVAASKDLTRDSVKTTFSGIYTITVTDINQCSNNTTQTVSIFKNPVITAPDVTVCLFSEALLKASGASVYNWSGPFVFGTGATATVQSASNIAPVIYSVTGTDNNSCVSSTTLFLHTLPLPVPYLTVSPGPTLCVNDEITFQGSGGINYQWRGPHNIYYEKQKVSFTCSSVNYSGVYTLTVRDKNGCSASADTLITVFNLPSGSVIGKTEGCLPFCSPLLFTPSSPAVKSHWKNGQLVHTGPDFTVCVTEPGILDITGNLIDTITGCKNTLSFGLTGFENPSANFVFDPLEPNEYEQVFFTSTSQGENLTSFQWFLQDPAAYPVKGPETTYLFKEEGNYPMALVVSNQWGCADTSIQVIKVYPDFHIYVPNVFTPNGDELNEFFLPVVSGPRVYQLTIFDRWGELMFETSDHTVGWDGTFKGQPCKVDSYIWKIKVAARKGELKEMNGNVSLVR